MRLRRAGTDQVRLSVEDDGIGWSGRDAPKGTGVGSRVVAAMARGLGTSVVHGDGPGCRIELTLPVTQS